MGGAMADVPTTVWSGQIRSKTAKRRDKIYDVKIMSDGTGTCSCMDFVMNRNRVGDSYRCKHLEEAFRIHGIEVVAATPPPAPVEPQRERVRLGLQEDEIRRITKRSSRNWDDYEI